jgi:hypothetical protein
MSKGLLGVWGLRQRPWARNVSVARRWVAGDLCNNDTNLEGQSAAYSLAKRARAKGLHVQIRIPDEEGTDWADHWAFTQSPKEVA